MMKVLTNAVKRFLMGGSDCSSNNATSTDSAAFDAINQQAAAILQKITAYDVTLIPLENNLNSENKFWYKREGERWVRYTLERGSTFSDICAENDDEMVYSVVWGSLDHYAVQNFVMWRERNGKDPYRKYDDFMEECLRIVYPDKKYERNTEYDDRKYEKLDAEYDERINNG